MDYHLTLNWPEFIERYWQKRPVVLKRGFTHFIDPISPDELAGLAMENEVDSRIVSHEEGKWQVSHGPFDSYDHLSETNWSLLVQAVNPEFKADPVVDIYLVASGTDTQSAAMRLAEQVRDALPGVKLMTNHGGGNFKKQFARADKWGASIALVLGESEVANGEVVVKDLRSGEQTTVTQDGVAAHLRTLLG